MKHFNTNTSGYNFLTTVKFAVKFILLAVTIIFLTGTSYSQLFLKSYDLPPYGSRTEYGYSIERNFDGTVVGMWSVAGVSNSTPNAGSFDWMFLKLTNSGTVTCATLLGFTQADSCFSHIQLANNQKRNVLAGFYRTPNGREKASYSFLDTNCFHAGSRQVMDSLRSEYRQVVKNNYDNFTMAGYIETFNPGAPMTKHILASQYSAAGALIWSFNYIPPFPWVDERAYSICFQPLDSSYAITGITNRFTGAAGPYQVFVMKINSAGMPLWYKGYSPLMGVPSEGKKIIPMTDGGFVITGSSTAYDAAGDIYTFRITAAGTIVWSNTYGMPGISETSESILYRPVDASLVLTGSANPTGSEDIILSKLAAATGAPAWTKRYFNPSGSDRGFDVKESSTPSGFSVTGKLYHSSSASLDPFFLKTDAFGNVTAVCQDSTQLQPRQGFWSGDCARTILQLVDITISPSVTNPTPVERIQCGSTTGISSNNEVASEFSLEQNYPNPFNPSTVIKFSVPENSVVSLTVFDASGREVANLVSGFMNKGIYSYDFNASGLSSGVYFYKLKAEGFEQTKKMLLVK